MNRQAPLQSGFTLIELMIAIVILGVLMLVAIPNLQDYVMNSRLTERANNLAGTFNYARSQAISLNRQEGVNVTAWVPGDGKNDWSRGWEIWVDGGVTACDEPRDRELNKANADASSCEILKSVRFVGKASDKPAKAWPVVTGPGNLEDISEARLVDKSATLNFRSNGMLGIASAYVDFYLCDSRDGEKGRHIRLLRTGRTVIQNQEYQCE